MDAATMHADEVETDVALVRRLLVRTARRPDSGAAGAARSRHSTSGSARRSLSSASGSTVRPPSARGRSR
jgi:hypothetical protein